MIKTLELDSPLALDPPATAKAASISTGLLYKLWRQGSGPPYLKVGSDRRVLVDDLYHWLESLKEAA